MPYDWMWIIAKASLAILVSGSLVMLIVRWRPILHPRWNRFVWCAVLLQGVALSPLTLSLPTPKAWPTFPRAMPDAASVSNKAKGFPTKSEVEIRFESPES